MKKFLFPTQDATIYSDYLTLNSGLDEILQIGKLSSGPTDIHAARSLVQFDISAISSSMAAGQIPIDTKFSINLFLARAENLQAEQRILAFPVSQSWSEGTGFFVQKVSNPSDGASWDYRTGVTASLSWSGSTFISTMGSENIECSYQFGYPLTDAKIDISPIVRHWISGSIENNGVVLKLSDEIETSQSSKALLNIFSRQSHTIYRPFLEVSWDSQSYITGSLVTSDITNSLVDVRNSQSSYSHNSICRVNLVTREKYPIKSFDKAASRFANTQSLPTSSYYGIMDCATNRLVVGFDEGSKISCDASGNYFYFSTMPLYADRNYKFLIKVVSDTTSQTIDTENTFRVIFYE